MKQIVIITLILAVFGFAIVGSFYMFDIWTMEKSRELLIKIESVIFLLGACVALIALLTGMKKKPQDE